MVPETVELEIRRLSPKGEGVAELGAGEIYIEGTLPGESVLARVGEPFAPGSARRPGQLIRILRPSPDRAAASQYAGLGGACALGLLKYPATLRLKSGLVREALEAAGAAGEDVSVAASEIGPGARNKSLRFFGLRDGRLVNGFYRPRSHEVQEVGACLLEPEWFSRFARELCCRLGEARCPVYDESAGRGVLRALLLRQGDGKERLAALITGAPPSPALEELLRRAAAPFGVEALFICVNRARGNAVLRGDLIRLGRRSHIRVSFFDYVFKVGPLTFLQVNRGVALELYRQAVAWCARAPERGRALDLCSGVGTMSLLLSRHFTKVTGLEIAGPSVRAARDNAGLNRVGNVEFVQGDLKDALAGLITPEVGAAIADPARSGLGEEACGALARLPPGARLSLIFCALPALRRDVARLLDLGFEFNGARGYDMFPFSSQVETLVLMTRGRR